MSRALALDAYRFASREYSNPEKQRSAMIKRYSAEKWARAENVARSVVNSHGKTQCAAVLLDMIERYL